MKRVVLVIVCCLLANVLTAQVIVGNDFIISSKKSKRLANRGLSFISINLGSRPNWNQLINGRGGRTLVVDVYALRHPEKVYTYRELAERVYVPPTVNGPFISRVPTYLLVAPTAVRLAAPKFSYRSKRS
jgi:hypothetical protein